MKQFLILTIAVVCAGCMQMKAVPHMDELLRLKDYSDEKDAQAAWIEGENKKFGRLLLAVQDGTIKNFPTQTAVTQEFGKPVLSDSIEDAGEPLTRWLYRHPIQKFATDRIYLYFDAAGQLVKSERVPSS